MSLFRKPKKRMQMRALANDDDEEINGSENSMDVDENMPQAPPAPIIRPKKEKSKDKVKPKQTLLSFGDEVAEDAEVFQVRKSSHSKKLMKRLDRERKRPEEMMPGPDHSGGGDSNGHPAGGKRKEDDAPSINSRKNDSYAKPKRTPEGTVLSGRAAISAIRDGDVSCSEDEEDAEPPMLLQEGSDRFRHAFVRHSGRSVRALLDSGAIPDAAVIHAARKKRQQARDGADFIPIQSNSAETSRDAPVSDRGSQKPGGKGGRLVREDGEGDGSDEDPDRIDVRGVGPQHSKRESINMAVANNVSDVDSGGEEWETQQIRKAVTHSQIMAAQQETYYGSAYVMPSVHQIADTTEMNPFAVAPVPASEAGLSREHLRPLASPGQASVTAQQLSQTLQLRLSVLREARAVRQEEFSAMGAELRQLGEKRDTCSRRAPTLASRYEFYQKLRAYLTDLIECLDEKMPALCALEARALTLHKRKAAFVTERRRADVRDQAQEVMQPIQGASKKDLKDEERSRRIAEREGRRLRRRRAREQDTPNVTHRDGDSSDDEVPQTESTAYQNTQDQIISDAGLLFSDTLEEFSSLAAVLSRMEEWRQQDMPAYVEAYAGLCLPKLAGPFLRLKLLLWNPIADENALDWEKMQWYRGLMLYGLSEDEENVETEESLTRDPDITLIPSIVIKVIIPKLTELVEGTWDPMSSSQTRRLATLLRRAAALPGPGPASKHLAGLAEAVIKRAQAALQHDVFIPLLPKSVVDAGRGAGATFLRRQTARGARLLSNLAALHGTIADSTLAPLALGALLQRYLLAGVRCCPPVYGAELCWAMGSCLPRAWERGAPPLQQFLKCCQEVLASLTDNPLHLKAVEQIRSTIAILQGGPSG